MKTIIAPIKSIWFKNWYGEWERSSLSPTSTNLRKIKMNIARTGQAGIFNK